MTLQETYRAPVEENEPADTQADASSELKYSTQTSPENADFDRNGFVEKFQKWHKEHQAAAEASLPDADEDESHESHHVDVQAEEEGAEPIPVDVKTEAEPAAVSKPQPRKEFVKQQEELWGAKDDIKPEDVPEGELTYEQYLAQRPVAQDRDLYRANGRVRDVITGKSVKQATYEAKLNETSAESHYDQFEVDAAHEEASVEDEAKNKEYDTSIRNDTEGEMLVKNDPRLQGLLSVGEEVLALYNNPARGEEFEEVIKPQLEAKKAIFNDLKELYESKNLDSRALNFITNKTYLRVEEPEKVPVEGSPYINGEKVKLLEFFDNTDEAQKAYTIEKPDGTIEAVYSNTVNFKREFTHEQPEKLSRMERFKNWFGKERQKIQEYGGYAYMGSLWNKAGNWLTSRNITEGMSDEEVQKQMNKNRRNNIMGLAALTVGAMVAQKFGVFEGIGLDANIESAAAADSTAMDTSVEVPAGNGTGVVENGSIASVDNAEGYRALETEPSFADNGADAASEVNLGVYDPAYDVPKHGSGLQLFDKLELSDSTWYSNASSLVEKFPQDFKRVGTDVQISHSGWLSPEARMYIESLRTR